MNMNIMKMPLGGIIETADSVTQWKYMAGKRFEA
jgi:hypothetical protein